MKRILLVLFIAIPCTVYAATPTHLTPVAQLAEDTGSRLEKDVYEWNNIPYSYAATYGIRTYTYVLNEFSKLVFFCNSVGYGVPDRYATQVTAPQEMIQTHVGKSYPLRSFKMNLYEHEIVLPSSEEWTWLICINEQGIEKVYTERPVIVSPFRF